MIQKIDANQTIAEACVYNGVVYLAGQVPDDDMLDIVGQTRQVLANIDKMLTKAGTDKSKLLTAQVFLKDLADFEAFNQEYAQWIKDCIAPTRATVQAHLVNPNWLIEIVVTAAKA